MTTTSPISVGGRTAWWGCGQEWRPRSLYASVFSWISVVGGRFLVVFLEHEAALTTAQLGTILAVSQIVSVGGSAVTGSWADALEVQKPGTGRALVLAGGVALGGMVFLLHGVTLPTTTTTTTTSVIAIPVLWHGFLRIIFAFSTSMVFPVMDGMCLEFLKRHPTASTQDYGKERMYGAISWGIANICVAVGLDYLEGFVAIYIMAVVVTVGTLLVVFFYARQEQAQQQQQVGEVASAAVGYRKRDSNIFLEDNVGDGQEGDSNILTSNDMNDESSSSSSAAPRISTFQMLYLLGSSCFGFCFIISQITQSSGQAIVDNLIFLYFEALGSSYTLMGLTVVLTVAFEIPIFHIAPTLLQRWGPGPLIPIASVSYIVRVWGYSLIPEGQVVYVLWLEPLHGVTFACMATAGVELVSSLLVSNTTSGSYAASAQSALQVLVGTGSVLGLAAGGWLEEVLGPRSMYRISGGVVLVGCTMFSIALYYCPSTTTSKNQTIRIVNEHGDDKVQDDKPNNNDVEMIRLVGSGS